LKWVKEGIQRKRPDKWKKEQQLVSPPWQCARSHITHLTFPDFQTHYSNSPPSPIHLTSSPVTFSYSPRWNYSWKGVVLTRLRRST
jgi:hypothetical protein